MCGIERILKLGAKMPRSEYPKDEVKKLELQIQKILGAVNTPSTPLDETHGTGESTLRSVPYGHGATTTFAPESGTPFVPPPQSCTER